MHKTLVKDLSLLVVGGVLGLLVTLPSAEAGPRLRGLGVQDLGVSSGIAAPSSSSAVFQNPAGLVYNYGTRLSLQGGVGESTDNRRLSGGLAYGTPGIALAAGVFNNRRDAGVDGLSSAYYGLGVYAHSIRTALGISGTTAIDPSSVGTQLNMGLLFFPYERFRLGLQANSLLDDGPSSWGAGMAFEADRAFHLVADVTTDPDFDIYHVMPGIWLGSDQLSATLSYSVTVITLADDNKTQGNGFSGGVSARLGRGVSLQMYYKQMTKYYASLTFDL